MNKEKNESPEAWNIHITPRESLLKVRVGDVWEYRDLLWLLVRRDVVSFYKQTILGPLWFFVQPLLTTIMFTLIFGRLGGFSTDGLPQPLFYLAGITCWNYFADCLTKTSTVFKDSTDIFSKVYFPRLIMPLSIVVSNLVRLGIQFILFLLAMAYYAYQGAHFQITWAVSLLPALIFLMAILGLGLGMIVSAMTTKYRDLAFLLTFGIQLLMYATTVIYPLSSTGSKYRWIIESNPMTPLIETFRFGFLGRGSFSWYSLGYSSVMSILILLSGVIIFNKVEKDFIDTI